MILKHENEVLLCVCRTPEHVITVTWLPDEDYGGEVYVNIHLTKLRWLERVCYAFRYIFGRQCKYGAFDEIILNPDDWEKVQKVADYLKQIKEKEQ